MALRLSLVVLMGCAGGAQQVPATASSPAPSDTSSSAPSPTPTAAAADVVSVSVTGSEQAYTFAVAIRSDETGCDRYADWWEVLSEDGDLLYRRVLAHSHPTEQPFTRTGGPVPIDADTPVRVRAHLHPGGYVGTVMLGTAAGAFVTDDPGPGFAADLETQPPLPDGCAF